MKRYIVILLIILIPTVLTGQEKMNLTDHNGLKQGLWSVKYPGGVKKYEGNFVDGKPAGEFKRYYPNGRIKAKMTYQVNSDIVLAGLYNENGTLFAKGRYKAMQKDSIWDYYTDGIVRMKVNYKAGKRAGKSTHFNKNGKVSSEADYVNGLIEGNLKFYYPSGADMSAFKYHNNKREGLCMTWYDNGETEMEGWYSGSLRDSLWTFYWRDGNVKYKLQYAKGFLVNPEAMDSVEQLKFEEFEKNRLTLKDPEKYINDPISILQGGK